MAQMLINGRKVDAVSKQSIEKISPVTGQSYAKIPRGDKADVELAVQAAQQALTEGWYESSATHRGRLLVKLSLKAKEHFDELSQLESQDTGKPLSQAQNDIRGLIRYLEFYGQAADKIMGEVLAYKKGFTAEVVREPLGVTAHIIPWNYPVQIFGRSVSPALAMGNATVIKPAEDASLTILRMAELALEVGFPAGVINVVTGYGPEAGAALAEHPGINFISFTGSYDTGVLVQQAAALNVVKCTLELGGKSAHLVFDDADLDLAIPSIVRGIIQNCGQTCTAGSRVLVQAGIYEQFMERLANEFSKAQAGTPEMDLNCGPVINQKQFERVNQFIQEGIEEGLTVVAEGSIASAVPQDGYFIKPTLFEAKDHHSKLMMKEIFGPVLVALAFDTEEQGVELANCTDYGLMTALWTENGRRQRRVARQVQSGQVFVNSYGAGGGIELPFGGVKKSGYGREKGMIALEEMSSTKTIVTYYEE